MCKQSKWRAEVEIKVPFHDVDAMHIVWHVSYVKYFEIARCALLYSIYYNYGQTRDSGCAWPVIDARVRFGKPARFDQLLTVAAVVREYENRLRISYEIRDAATGGRITRGSTTQVAVCLATNEMCYVSPPVLLEKLGLEGHA